MESGIDMYQSLAAFEAIYAQLSMLRRNNSIELGHTSTQYKYQPIFGALIYSTELDSP